MKNSVKRAGREVKNYYTKKSREQTEIVLRETERQVPLEIGSDVYSNGAVLCFFTRTDVLLDIFKDIGGREWFLVKKNRNIRVLQRMYAVCKNSFRETTAFGYILPKVP